MGGLAADARAALAVARRNLRVQMREHLLGHAWALLTPALYAIGFLTVKRALGAGSDAGWGQPFHAFVGIMLLQLWFQVLQDTADVAKKNRGILRGLSVGVGPFVLAPIFEGAFSLLVRFVIIAAAWILLGIPAPDDALDSVWLAASATTVLLSAAAIGTVLAPWSAIFPDVRKAVASSVMPMTLLSPIFYPAVIDSSSPLFFLNLMNPLAACLAVIGAISSGQTPVYADALVVWLAASITLLVLGGRIVSRQLPILLERLG